MNSEQLRQKRMAAGISGILLSSQAGIDRGRLSLIERGYVRPTDQEMTRIETALAVLIQAKLKVSAFAAECGWPLSAL